MVNRDGKFGVSFFTQLPRDYAVILITGSEGKIN
jgi:hypothetical protein